MHVWKSNFIDLHKVLWHFFKMRFPIRSVPVDLSGFRSHKISLICFPLHVSLIKLSLVFVVVTLSHKLNTEIKYRLNSSAFSLSTNVSSLFNFTVGGMKAAFRSHVLQILLNLTKISLFKNRFFFRNLVSHIYSTV